MPGVSEQLRFLSALPRLARSGIQFVLTQLRKLVIPLQLMLVLALAAPVFAQRGGTSRSEPVKTSSEVERPSFVLPSLVGAACIAVIALVVFLPTRRIRDRNGKP
jgi:hypothetical protein